MAAIDEPRQPHDHATSITAPVGGVETGKGGDEVAVTIVRNADGEFFYLGGTFNDFQVVPQPLDQTASHRDRALEGIYGVLLTDLVADRGQQAVLADDSFGTGIEQDEAASPVGVLRFARAEAGLPEGGGLLIAQDSGNGYTCHGRR